MHLLCPSQYLRKHFFCNDTVSAFIYSLRQVGRRLEGDGNSIAYLKKKIKIKKNDSDTNCGETCPLVFELKVEAVGVSFTIKCTGLNEESILLLLMEIPLVQGDSLAVTSPQTLQRCRSLWSRWGIRMGDTELLNFST